MIVLCKSKRAATRVFESLTRFIEKKLLLRVNRKKSKIVYVGNRELKFLGYGFAPLKGRIIPTVHFRSKAKFKDRIRKILHRNKGQRTRPVYVRAANLPLRLEQLLWTGRVLGVG